MVQLSLVVKLFLVSIVVVAVFLFFASFELPATSGLHLNSDLLRSLSNSGSSGSNGNCVQRFSDQGKIARIAFNSDETNIPLEVVRSKTDPPFLQVIVPANDPCKNYPGQIINQHGFFAPVETTIFHKILKNGCKQLGSDGRPPLVVDVGANIGYFTNYASAMGCRVMSFEPIPRVARFLNFSVMINDARGKVEVNQAAASDHNGRDNIHLNCGDSGQSTIQSDHTGDVQIRLVRLDEIVKEDVLLLKIDTEGYEDQVLKGAKGLFENYKIDNIVCETKKTNDVNYKVKFMNDMIAKGYKLYSYWEYYNIEGNSWSTKVKQDVDMTDFKRLREVTAAQWIPAEDLWYIRE